MMPVVSRVETDADGKITNFVIQSDFHLALHDIDYNLDPKPHDSRIRRAVSNSSCVEMAITAEEMSKILFKFSCCD